MPAWRLPRKWGFIPCRARRDLQVYKRLVSEFVSEDDVEAIAGVLHDWMAVLEGRASAQA